MATDNKYLDFILDQLSNVEGRTYRQMIGEYVIYINCKIAAYLRDNRLLIKPSKSAIDITIYNKSGDHYGKHRSSSSSYMG